MEVARFFTERGWKVDSGSPTNEYAPDLLIRKGSHFYLAEVKTAPEPRPDRVIALLAQAILEARTYAKKVPDAKPLALVHVKEVPEALIRRAANFTEHFAPGVAIGLIGADGRRYFEGDGVVDLTKLEDRPFTTRTASIQPFNLFSDLNQWMLKVLLAAEIPDHMLSAPRQAFRSGTDLAVAAQVSPMSVSRFLNALRKDAFLAPGRVLKLVRRDELFRRWKASVNRDAPEQAFKYLVPGSEEDQLRKFVSRYRDDACVGLFDAAEAFGLGHVSGATSHVYVRKLATPNGLSQWKGIRPVREAEKPGLILRQPLTPESVFRGAVAHNDVLVTDVIQVWLDVSSHPARGREQAELLEKSFLNRLIEVTA